MIIIIINNRNNNNNTNNNHWRAKKTAFKSGSVSDKAQVNQRFVRGSTYSVREKEGLFGGWKYTWQKRLLQKLVSFGFNL